MFENKLINGEYATRYIVSWVGMGGKLGRGKDLDDFAEWLKSIDVSADDIYHITLLATCGKFELERSAEKFIKQKGLE